MMRLTIVQYAGDFREASQRLESGGEETYGAQRYTVNYVEQLAKRLASVTTITGFTEEPYDTLLRSGARAVGAGFRDTFDVRTVARLVERTKPDLLILRTPSRGLMRWAIRKNVRTMVLLADSFDGRSFKGKITRILLSRILRDKVFDVVANHGINSAQQLVTMGIPAHKVFAWDYPSYDSPENRSPKLVASPDRRIVFVGMLIADKGVDDLIDAAGLLAKRGLHVSLDLIGKGETGRLQGLINGLGLGDRVRLVGQVPHSEIIERMAQADAVIVPSRHEYSEGTPLTIYEAYCSRTPVIVSDHPMFVGNVDHEKSGLIFQAGNADALAHQIERVFSNDGLYHALSVGGAAAWHRMQVPVKWGDLIDQWLEGSDASRAWLRAQAIHEASSRPSAS